MSKNKFLPHIGELSLTEAFDLMSTELLVLAIAFPIPLRPPDLNDS